MQRNKVKKVCRGDTTTAQVLPDSDCCISMLFAYHSQKTGQFESKEQLQLENNVLGRRQINPADVGPPHQTQV